ncbi:unnamed protein product [Gadus morhua 'NCC']
MPAQSPGSAVAAPCLNITRDSEAEAAQLAPLPAKNLNFLLRYKSPGVEPSSAYAIVTQTLAGPPDVVAACLGLEEHLNCQCLGEKGGGRQVVNMVWVHTSTSSTSASAATSISHSPHPVGSRWVLWHGATPPTPLLCRRGAGTSKVAAG